MVDYKIDYNRNSIQHSLRIDGGFVASTPSGALMKFESPSMRLVKDNILDQTVTALGHGQAGEPLAGFSDGRICRIDPVSLELTERFKLSSEPQWIGWIGAVGNRPAGLVVIAESTILKDFKERPMLAEASAVHDLAVGKRCLMGSRASAFMPDRAGGLWLGSDHGEWGGDVTRLDLEKGTLKNVPGPSSSVFWKGKPYQGQRILLCDRKLSDSEYLGHQEDDSGILKLLRPDGLRLSGTRICIVLTCRQVKNIRKPSETEEKQVCAGPASHTGSESRASSNFATGRSGLTEGRCTGWARYSSPALIRMLQHYYMNRILDGRCTKTKQVPKSRPS